MGRVKEVILYTQPGCGPCVSTKRFLEKYQIAHMTLDIREFPEAAEKVRGLGYQGTPVVEVITSSGGFHWNGFRIDKLNHLRDITRQ